MRPEKGLAEVMQVRQERDMQVRKFQIADRVQDRHGRIGIVVNIPEYNVRLTLPAGDMYVEAEYEIQWEDSGELELVRESGLSSTS